VSSIWGTTTCRINNDSKTTNLVHSIVEPNFMIPAEIMHESSISGKRTWNNPNNYMAFSVMDYLFRYDSPQTQANNLLDFEDSTVTFSFATDGGLVLNLYLESVDFYPLLNPYDKDVAVLNLKSIDYVRISRRIRDIPGKRWIKAIGGDAQGKILRTKGIII